MFNPWVRKIPWRRKRQPLQYSCLENPTDEGACRLQSAAAKSLQSCPTLCEPIDGSPPGSPISGILQARTLEWVAISFSNEWKWKVKVKSLSHVRLFATPWTAACQAPPSMGFSRQKYWSGVPLPFPGYSLQGPKESDTPERLHFHFPGMNFSSECESEFSPWFCTPLAKEVSPPCGPRNRCGVNTDWHSLQLTNYSPQLGF